MADRGRRPPNRPSGAQAVDGVNQSAQVAILNLVEVHYPSRQMDEFQLVGFRRQRTT